jgi:hypothetical protein
MRLVWWLIGLAFVVGGCHPHQAARDSRVKILETGRIGGVIQEKTQ